MNQEERILEMLEKLSEKVDRQSETLAKHTELLTRQDELLAEHSKLLAKQGKFLEELDDRSLRTAAMLENDVLPRLQLLYEGQAHLRETLAPKARLEVLEDEVISLKSAIKEMMNRLDALEKVQ